MPRPQSTTQVRTTRLQLQLHHPQAQNGSNTCPMASHTGPIAGPVLPHGMILTHVQQLLLLLQSLLQAGSSTRVAAVLIGLTPPLGRQLGVTPQNGPNTRVAAVLIGRVQEQAPRRGISLTERSRLREGAAPLRLADTRYRRISIS